MTHRDVVTAAPPASASWPAPPPVRSPPSKTPARGLYGVQFHPEVVHTSQGAQILDELRVRHLRLPEGLGSRPSRRAQSKTQIRQCVGDRNVFFFVSGGVDSTVAFTLCLRALGAGRVRGVYVDTGLMREGETEFVRAAFRLGAGVVEIAHAKRVPRRC